MTPAPSSTRQSDRRRQCNATDVVFEINLGDGGGGASTILGEAQAEFEETSHSDAADARAAA